MPLQHAHLTTPPRIGTATRALRRRVSRIVFERGIDVEDTYGLEAVELDGHPDRRAYEPSSWRILARGLRGERITPSDGFIDYGAGKGRIVFQAARYPFGHVLGLEISERLADVARRQSIATASASPVHASTSSARMSPASSCPTTSRSRTSTTRSPATRFRPR